MCKSFKEGVKTPLKGLVEEKPAPKGSGKATLSYLSWATAVALADRPSLVTVMDKGLPYRNLFGGVYVSVACEGLEIPLPVLDNKNQPVSESRMNVRDLNDTISRCRAKAIAFQTGVGLALYAGYGDDTVGFIKACGVVPDADLSKVQPLEKDKSKKGFDGYVPWPAAWMAAKLTDPDATFRVCEYTNTLYGFNPETGEAIPEQMVMPALSVAGGWMVGVEITYKGVTHTELLPIMGTVEVNGKKRNHVPLDNPTVFDWNTAVMRCLAKGIAVVSGYGLSVYAGEDVEDMNREAPAPRQSAPATHATPEPAQADNQAVTAKAVMEEMTEM